MSMELRSLGATALMAQLNSRLPALAVFREFQEDARGPNPEFFAGAVGHALDLLTIARNNSVTLSSPNEHVDTIIKTPSYRLCILLNQMVAAGNRDGVSNVLWVVGSALDSIARSHPHMLRSQRATSGAEPLEVRVVSLPDRRTDTLVERDEAGDLVGSVQIERDAA